MKQGRAKPAPLPSLTPLRMIAAGLVYAYHISSGGTMVAATNPLRTLAAQGWSGVYLFFVLSGFLLAYNYAEVKQRAQFYAARLARIYPAYVAALAVLMLMNWRWSLHQPHGDFPWGRLGATVLIVQAWLPVSARAINPAAWTICVEMLFYLLFPVLLPAVERRLARRRVWMTVIWAVFVVVPLLEFYGPRVVAQPWAVTAGSVLQSYSEWPPVHLGPFLLGMFAGAQFRRAPVKTPGWQVLLWAAACVTALYALACVPRPVTETLALTPLYTGLLTSVAGWRAKVMESYLLQLGGEISYSFYLLAFPVGMATAWVLKGRLGLAGENVLATCVLLPVALASYLWLEKPARRAILRWLAIPGRAKPIPTREAMV